MVLINDNSSILAIGDALPHFDLPATDGLTVDSSTIKDPVMVVIFTCNHCPYADAYWQRIIDLAEHFDEEGVQVVTISSNDATNYPDDSFEAMKSTHDELGLPFPYLYDESQEVARAFGALCTPHCFVFNQERNLTYKGRVDDSWDDVNAVSSHDLRDAISATVHNQEVAVPEANAIGCSIKWREHFIQ